MDASGNDTTASCYRVHRLEILGIILLIIATFLTIASHDSAGIVMLFLVGLALCIHKCFAGGMCCYHSHPLSETPCCKPATTEFVSNDAEIIKTPRTPKATKKDTLG